MLLGGHLEEFKNAGVAHRIYSSQLGRMSGKSSGVGDGSGHQRFLINGGQAEWAKSGGWETSGHTHPVSCDPAALAYHGEGQLARIRRPANKHGLVSCDYAGQGYFTLRRDLYHAV